METKKLLREIDWALDSILPIEEQVTEGDGDYIIMCSISQLRGHLLGLRDKIVFEGKVLGRKELYHPLEALTLENMRILPLGFWKDMPNNLAEKHFDETEYRKYSKANRELMARGE